jgi:hypothetical protein
LLILLVKKIKFLSQIIILTHQSLKITICLP